MKGEVSRHRSVRFIDHTHTGWGGRRRLSWCASAALSGVTGSATASSLLALANGVPVHSVRRGRYRRVPQRAAAGAAPRGELYRAGLTIYYILYAHVVPRGRAGLLRFDTPFGLCVTPACVRNTLVSRSSSTDLSLMDREIFGRQSVLGDKFPFFDVHLSLAIHQTA